MKYTKYIFLITLLTECNPETKNSEQSLDAPREVIIGNLLSKFEQVSIDTLEVFSVDETNEDYHIFRGTRLDSVDLTMFPSRTREVYSYDHEFYGCYQFNIDSTYTGLIARTPSKYMPSSIKLFILNSATKEIPDTFVELGESIGDAGYSMTKTTFIYKEGPDLRMLIWQQDNEDMSVENENDTTIRTLNFLHLLKINKGKFDTINSDTEPLIKKYKQIAKSKELK